MTSHHDVAGLCERLRVNTCRYADETEEAAAKRRIATDLAAADLLESQAKALSEHEVAYDGLMKAKETFRAEAHRNAARALAAEARLADVKRELTPSGETKSAHIGEYHFEIEMLDEDGETILRRIAVPWTTIKEIMAAIAARAFTNAATNAAKEKT